jgi:hypothetical protein
MIVVLDFHSGPYDGACERISSADLKPGTVLTFTRRQHVSTFPMAPGMEPKRPSFWTMPGELAKMPRPRPRQISLAADRASR